MATQPLTAAVELPGEPLVREQVGLWTDAWRRLRRNRLALFATIYLSLLVLVALVAIVYTPFSTSHQGVAPTYAPPSRAHPLGADASGRDILSRLMVGAQISLVVGLTTQAIVLAVGVPLGLIAGYFRGWIDTVLSFLISVFYGIPDILVAMILIVLLGKPGLDKIIIAIAATRWMDMARLTRGQTLSLREREFVEAARASGSRTRRILFGHVLPNALGPIIVQVTLDIKGKRVCCFIPAVAVLFQRLHYDPVELATY